MDVSPTMLREAEFRIALRGYSCEEVDQFLETAASGLEGMQERLRQAVERAQRAESAAANAQAAGPAPAAPVPAPAPAPAVSSAEGNVSDETLRKTLVLAQRTADLAVQEAREQAARILSAAESQAQARVTEAEERARRTHEDALSDIRAELTSLEVTRQRAQQEVDALNRWVEEHRGQISQALSEALSHVERVGVRSPVPTSRPIDLPPLPRPGPAPQASLNAPPASSSPPAGSSPSSQPAGSSPGGAPSTGSSPAGSPPGGSGRPNQPPAGGPGPARNAGPAPFPPGGGGGPSGERGRPPQGKGAPRPEPQHEGGPPTQAWSPEQGTGRDQRHDEVDPTPGHGSPRVGDERVDLDEEDQAFDEFFDEGEGDDGLANDRRFGGRLRRRH